MRPDFEVFPPLKQLEGVVSHFSLPHGEVVDFARPLFGETVREFIDRQGWENGSPIVCYETDDQGRPIALLRAEWYRPIATTKSPVFVSAPLGGGGGGGGSQSVLAIVAMIALIVVANVLAPGIGTALGLGAVGIHIITALIIAGGSLLISHFLRPKAPSNPAALPAYDFALGNNQSRPGQPIPVLHGRLKYMPDMADAPWSDYSGLDQTYHALFCLGVGEMVVEEIGVNLTPIWRASTGFAAGFGGVTTANIQAVTNTAGDVQGIGGDVRFQLYGPGAQVTLFPINIASASGVAGQQFPDPYGTVTNGVTLIGPNGENSGPQFLGPYVVNAAGSLARSIAIDFGFPGGVYDTDAKGKLVAPTVGMICEYQYVDDQGHPIDGFATLFAQSLTLLQKSPSRMTMKVDLPHAGRIQVRMARTTLNRANNGTAVMNWIAARAYVDGPQARPNVTLLALQAKADKLLSGYTSQQFYVIATGKKLVYQNGTWVSAATRSPYWAAADMWSDNRYGGGQDRNKIDISTFAALAAAADTRGDYFDHRFIGRGTLINDLNTCLQSGLATPLPLWDQLSAVRDEARPLPRVMLTDFEIIRGTMQSDYRFAPSNPTDGVVVQYFDNNTWLMQEISSTGTVANLQNPSRVVLDGVTDRAQAFRNAVYLDRANRYRRVTHTLEVEGEGQLLKRGDLVIVSSELPGTWGATVRLDSYDLSNSASPKITAHTALDWTVTGQRYVRIKTKYGVPFGPVRCSQGATPNVLVIDAVDLAYVQTQQSAVLSDVLSRSAIEEVPSAVISIGAPQEFAGLVHDIGPGGQQGHIRLDLVPYASAQMYATTAAVPALPAIPTLVLPKAPGVITGLGATLLQEQAALTLRATWQPDTGSESYEARYSVDSGVTWQAVYSGYAAAFEAKGFSGANMLLQVRGQRGNLRSISWSQITITAPTIATTLANLGVLVQYTDLATDILAPLHSAIDSQAATELATAISLLDERVTNQSSLKVVTSSLVDLKALVVGHAANSVSGLSSVQTAVDSATASVAAVNASLSNAFASIAAEAISINGINVDLQSSKTLLASEIAANTAAITSVTAGNTNLSGFQAAQTGALGASVQAAADDINLVLGLALLDQKAATDLVGVRTNKAQAGVTTNTQAIIDANNAFASSSQVIWANLANAVASVSTESAARVNADNALSGRIDTNSASIGSTNATVSSETAARVSGDNALGIRIDTNSASIGSTNATVASETTARVAADGALSGRIDTTVAHLGTTDANVTSEAVARTNADSALSGRIDTTVASLATTNANATSETTARAAADGALSTRIDTNAASIGTTNASVATETAARVSADSALSTRVDTNVASIGTTNANVTSEIATRTSADNALGVRIDTTTASLGTTNANLSSEATARANADSALSGRVDTNTASIGTTNAAVSSETAARVSADSALSGRIDTNTASIGATNANVTSEAAARASADGALSGRIDTATASIGTTNAAVSAETTARTNADGALSTRIDTANASIGTTNANVTTETAARVAADGALSTRIDTNTAAIGTTNASVTSEAAARASADGALSGRIDTANASIGSNTAAISAEAAARVTAIGSQASQTGNLGAVFQATIDDAGTATGIALLDQKVASDVAARAATKAQAGVTTNSTAIANAKSATASLATQLLATIGVTNASVASESAARATADTALSTRIDTNAASIGTTSANVTSETAARVAADGALSGRIDTNTANIGTTNAAVASETTARVNADGALSGRIDSTNASLGTTNANVTSEIAARTNADGALSTRIDTNTASIGTTNAAVSTETNARTSADSALSTRIDTNTASIGTTNAAVSSETTARTTADNALSGRIDTANASIGTTNANVTSESAARVSADNALSGRIDTNTASIGTTNAAVTSETNARTSADNALSTRIDTNTASIGTTNSNVTSETSARVSAVNALSGRIDTNTSAIGTTNTAVTNEASTRASADSALSSSLATVSAKTDAGTAAGKIAFVAQSSLAAGVSASYELQLSSTGVGGTFASTGFFIELLSSGASRFVVNASQFQVGNAATRVVPFVIDSTTGVVTLQGVTKVASVIQSLGNGANGLPFLKADFGATPSLIFDDGT